MSSLRRVICGAMLGGWAVLVLSSHALAEGKPDPTTPKVYTTKDYWQQRVLRQSQPQPAAAQQTPASRGMPQRWSPVRPGQTWPPVDTVSNVIQMDPVLSDMPGDELMLDAGEPIIGPEAPLPFNGEYYEPGACGACAGGCEMGCSSCGQCYGNGWCSPHCAWQGWWQRHCWWVRRLYLFAGVHGFKGPADLGRNGNFGFHEGVNWGAPLGGPFCVGYQLGMEAVHSNFSGDQTDAIIRESDRDQIFFTGGLFRRAVCGGFQWGVAFDLLHDTYYGTADLRQIRTETALVFSGCREIGFWGAFGVGDDGFDFTDDVEEDYFLPIGPNDTYSLFYRRHFSGGGQGRLWAGVSGQGDAVIGGDCTVPLGTSWALENNFTYLVPKEGHGEGQQDETWSVSIQLVWYPGRQAACVLSDPFHPLLSVADNSHFLLRRR